MHIEASKTKNVLTIITLALLLAAVFDYLFMDKVVGVSTIIYAGLVVLTLYGLAVKFKYSYKSSLWLIPLVIFFALMPSIRANLFLSFLNVLAIIGLLFLAIKEILQEKIRKFGVKEYFFTVFGLPLKFLVSTIKPLLYLINAFSESPKGKWRRVLIGVLLALPVLTIFTLLLSSADMAFGQFVNSVFSLKISEVFIGHVMMMGIIFVAMLGTMEYIFHASTGLPVVPPAENSEIATTGREVETGVFLSLIGTLFLIFIGFQITYLFGGEVNIIEKGFTYAEYARHGFWELLMVASATLVLLFFADKYTRRETSRKTWFTFPTSIIILEILVIIISAFKRLMLYQDAYGMTALRFYVAGFIFFIGVLFILLAIKFILEKKENFFTFATLLTIIVFLVGVNFINPDKFIAKQNITRFEQTGKIDASYLGNLSPDAIPQVIAVYDRLSEADKNTVKEKIRANQIYWKQSLSHWQSYNFSTSKATNKLHDFLAN